MKWTSRLVEEMARLLLANRAEHKSTLSRGRPLGRRAIRGCVPPALALFLIVPVESLLISQPRLVFAAGPEPLHLEVFTGDENSWGVTSTLIYGKTEALLIDSQFHNSQASKLAERITGLGRQLSTIIITHPDGDHYLGLGVLHERFPDAKIYMTEAALGEFKRTAGQELARQKKNTPTEMPESLPTPEVLSKTLLLVDGQPVEVIKDFQGDVKRPMNSFIWVPSLEALIAGDIVFDGVHPWLADSNEQTRRAWLHSLALIASLHPRIVVPGHKGDQDLPNSARTLDSMRRYLRDFELARKAALNADGLVATMKQKYPNLKVEKFLVLAARAAFPPPPAE
jgi:glyoxylase-like metal-dependent hydrolase (beta-lactamase superfamily II)